jgi:hypothetical protein
MHDTDRQVELAQPLKRRGLRKKSLKPPSDTAELLLERQQLCAVDSESDTGDTAMDTGNGSARALKFELSAYRANSSCRADGIDRYDAHYSGISIPYDTDRWLQSQESDTDKAKRSASDRHGQLADARTGTVSRKRKIEQLLLHIKNRLGKKNKSVSSITLDNIPCQLRTGTETPFESLLAVHALPMPWNAGYVEIQPDRQVDHTDAEKNTVFLNNFCFSIGVWWLTAHPETVYVTLEAEHREGYAQCTYGIPNNRNLELSILETVCVALF